MTPAIWTSLPPKAGMLSGNVVAATRFTPSPTDLWFGALAAM